MIQIVLKHFYMVLDVSRFVVGQPTQQYVES